jgi:DNA polymerase-4
LYGRLVAVLTDLTPTVQQLPPTAAVLDLTGALRFFDTDPAALARRIQFRALAQYNVSTSIGLAPNRLLATMAADATGPHHLTTVTPGGAEAFLRPRPVAALPGVGPATARTLTRHGLHTVGALADTPLLTLQRLLGTALGRQLHERAHAHDPRPVVPQPPVRSLSAVQEFVRDELDPAAHRRALLALTGELGARLRADAQVTGGLAITIRYADGSATTRSRTLAEPTHHTTALTSCAYGLYEALGLQRARVREISLRCENLGPAEHATRQLSFDHTVDKALLIEAVQDRARLRYGSDVIKPASLAAPKRPDLP